MIAEGPGRLALDRAARHQAAAGVDVLGIVEVGGEQAEFVGARRVGAEREAEIGVGAILGGVFLERRQVVGHRALDVEVAEEIDPARAEAEAGVEGGVGAFLEIVEIGGARRGEHELEGLVRLPERAQAGVEAEAEVLGLGLPQEVEAEPGVAVVAVAGRGVVEVVVGVDHGALRDRRGQRRPRPGPGPGRWRGESRRQPPGSGRRGRRVASPPHSKRRRSGTTMTSPSRMVIIDWMAPPRSTALKLKR